MKKLYHLLVTSYKLQVARFKCFTSYLLPHTSYLFLLFAFCFLPSASVVAQCPDFNDPNPITNPHVKAYYGYQNLKLGDNALNYTEPNSHSSNPSSSDSPVPRSDAPFLYDDGPIPNRHKVMEWPPTNDPIIGAALQTLPPGSVSGDKAIKLGNDQIYYECEALVYEFVPEIENPILLLSFAVVFQDPNHSFAKQPLFIFRVTDTNGDLLEECTEYDVTSAANIPGFHTWQPQGSYQGEERKHTDLVPVHWRDWTEMSVDLSKFIGETIQVQIINYDCGQGAHFGYSYFTAKCVPNTLQLVEPCESTTSFTLEAPNAFESYLWSNGETTRTATFGIDTIMDSQITCKVISQMGCECTLYAYITHDDNITQNVINPTDVICEGETYILHNFNLPPQETGTHFYQLAIIDPVACEVSESNLELKVIERYNHIKDGICHGDPFNNNYWNKIPEYPTPGVWRDTVYTEPHPTENCDLYDVLELVVSMNMETLAIQGDTSPCTEELITCSFLGAETLTYVYWELPTNAVAVSSVYNPQLTLYFTDDTPGTIVLHAANGCGPGTATLNITPYPSYDIQLNDVICQGLVYSDSDNGFNLGVQNEVGFFVHSKHLQSIHGCDSTVTLRLNVLPVHSVRIEPIDTVICNQGDEVTLWALIDEDEYQSNDCPNPDIGHILFAFHYNCGYSYSWSTGDITGFISVTPNTTTTYTVTVLSDIGCEFTASQTVVVNDVNVAIDDTICYGETYSAYGINVYDATPLDSKSYDGSILTDGCTVEVTVNLTVLDEAKFIIPGTFCSGDTYTDHGFHFELGGEGSYIDTVHFISKAGCDSLVIFNFTINPQKETFINDNICQFETYDKNGFDTVQNFAGMQILTKPFLTSEGCDSIVVVRLNVYPNPVNVVDFGVVSGYPGTTTTFINWSIYYDESIIAGWEWYLDDESSPFATTKDASYIFTEAGDYTVTLKVKSINGCWDEVTKDITIEPCPVPTINPDDTEVTACGLETVTIEGSFEDVDKISIKTLNSNGRKARLTVHNDGTFTVTYSPTIANVGKVVEIVLTAIDSTLPCAVATESVFITVKAKPKIRTKGVCIE